MIDRISYYTICAVSAGLLGFVAFEIVKSLVENYERNKSVVGVIVSVAIIVILGFLVSICVRNFVKERKNGVRCECIGDCLKCKIQCQSNPNYYGIQRKGEQK